MRLYRLPDGTETENKKVYLAAWNSIAWALEALTGWAVSGFDPDFILTSGTTTVSLPMVFVQALLTGHNKRIQAVSGRPTKPHRPEVRTTRCQDCGVEVHSIGRGRNRSLCRTCANARKKLRNFRKDDK